MSRATGLSPRAALVVVFVVLSLVVSSARAGDGGLAVQVAPGQTNCFYEEASAVGVKMFMHYLVSAGGSLDIDCSVTAPDGSLVWNSERETESRLLFKSRMPGAYAFCFSNRMSTLTSKVVSFSVMVGNGNAADAMQPQVADKDPLHRSIMRLQAGLREIEELQQVLRTREREHRATTEVANTRVVLFCLTEIIFIVGMGLGSIAYLRKMFVTKRMV